MLGPIRGKGSDDLGARRPGKLTLLVELARYEMTYRARLKVDQKNTARGSLRFIALLCSGDARAA